MKLHWCPQCKTNYNGFCPKHVSVKPLYTYELDEVAESLGLRRTFVEPDDMFRKRIEAQQSYLKGTGSWANAVNIDAKIGDLVSENQAFIKENQDLVRDNAALTQLVATLQKELREANMRLASVKPIAAWADTWNMGPPTRPNEAGPGISARKLPDAGPVILVDLED